MTDTAVSASLPDDLRALREAAKADFPNWKKYDAAESRILSTVAALTAERDALKLANESLARQLERAQEAAGYDG